MIFGSKMKAASISVALVALCLGGTGCKLLKMAAKTQKHAAIAFDEKTGGWGYSHDFLTADLAKAQATAKCGSCTVRVAWNQGCGALAQSTTNKTIMTTGLGDTKLAAEGAAQADCAAKGGGVCKILVYSCNSTN